MFNATPRPFYPRERGPVPIVVEAGWAPGPIWTVAEYLASTDIRTPDLQPTATPTTLSRSTDTLLQDDNIHGRMVKSGTDSAPEKVSSPRIKQNATLQVILHIISGTHQHSKCLRVV